MRTPVGTIVFPGSICEIGLLRGMAVVAQIEVWPAVLAWITAVAVPLIMVDVLRTEKRRAV